MVVSGAALLAATAISGGAQAIAANKAQKGIDKATAAETAANDKALALQERMYNQTRADNEPWRQVGLGALQQLARTYNISVPQATWAGGVQQPAADPLQPKPFTPTPFAGGGALASAVHAASQRQAEEAWNASEAARVEKAKAAAQAAPAPAPATPAQAPAPGGQFGDFFASPDYQFRVNQGITAITGNKAARGLLDSGALGKGLINYGQQAGAQEYGNWFSRLSSLAGIGQSANQSNIAAAQNNAGAQGAIIQNQGQNLSSSYQTKAGIQAGMINNVGNMAGGYLRNWSF